MNEHPFAGLRSAAACREREAHQYVSEATRDLHFLLEHVRDM
jgi:hypothetical protein